MKKLLLLVTVMALINLPFTISAQDIKEEKIIIEEKVDKKEKIDKKETQEIIIRNKGGKDINLKVEVNGDKITVNGKPLAEFKDDEVSVDKRKITIRGGGDRMMTMDFDQDNMMHFDKNFMKEWKGEGKELIKPFLGVTTEKTDDGAKITEVVKASAAEKAGLKVNDIITKVGDQKITGEESLSELIAAKKPKEAVKISYTRNGKESSVKATLGERKVKENMEFAFRSPGGKVRSFSAPRISGAPNIEFYQDELADLQSSLGSMNGGDYSPYPSFPRQKKLGLKIQDTDEGGNVKVIEVEAGSAAEKAGLKKDDIITEIGGKKVNNTDEAREQLNPEEAKSSYNLKALRNGVEMSFDVKIPKKLKTANL